MKILDKRVYIGRNIYSHKLCIKLVVDVEEYYDTPTKDIKGFNDKLIKALPGLAKHKCSVGYEGGFLERLQEGTYLPHVYEHIIIEMQDCLGFKNIKFGKTRCAQNSIYNVIFQYELKEAGLLCAQAGLEMMNSFIEGKDYNIKNSLEKIEKEIIEIRLGPSTQGILDEAVKRGIPVIRFNDQSILQLGYGKYQKRIEATLTDRTSCVAVDTACDKILTKEILKQACLPVAKGEYADNIEDVKRIKEKMGYPLVVKPLNGNHGRGVTVNIVNDDDLTSAYSTAAVINRKVVVERYITGRDYRVLVVDKKVIAVSLRLPPSICGDRIHTIKELVDEENNNPVRGYGHEKPMTKIPVDEITIGCLKANGYCLESVPDSGEIVNLRLNANLSTGGIAKDCTDIIHPDNIEIAIRAVEAIGLDIGGVDICTKDISKSIMNDNGVIIEVNAAPGIRMHMYPALGKCRNVPSCILDYLFPEDVSNSIPVIAITGTNGKTTVTRMISHIFELKGLCVGMTTTSGVYINNKNILKGDNTGPDSARTILTDRHVEVAVLETARGGIVRKGLGYDLSDVGVITNVSEDHLGIDGINTIEELIDAKSLIVEAIKDHGYAVLNADDPSVNVLNKKVRCNIIYFSMNPDNIILKKHLLDGGLAVFLKDNYICLGDGEKTQTIINCNDLPSTLEGKLSYNIENAMAAAAGCIGLKLDAEPICKGLKTFYLDKEQNPGRFNVYNVDNFKVVVDYGHNIAGYQVVIKSLKEFNAKRLIGIIGVPGDRTDESIIKIGSICAEGFDEIYIKEDVDRRGRREGEVARLLETGLQLVKKSELHYSTVLNEGLALREAMENAEDGDVIIVFYEEYETIISEIESFNKNKIEINNIAEAL